MIEKEYVHDLMNRLVTESQKEMTLHFELRPLEAYLLVSLVQLATTHDDIPENPKDFGERFIKAFCDRYREELPAMVESFELSNEENFLMTKDEFEELIDDGSEVIDYAFDSPLTVIRRDDDAMLAIPIGDNFPHDYEDDFA